MRACVRPSLTLLHAGRDGDEGHERTEAQVDPQQQLVEVAARRVGVEAVHEGEGHAGDGVEDQGGAHHRQVPPLVLRRPRQPGDPRVRKVRGPPPWKTALPVGLLEPPVGSLRTRT